MTGEAPVFPHAWPWHTCTCSHERTCRDRRHTLHPRRCKGHLHYASDNGILLLSGELNQSVPAQESTYTVTVYLAYPIHQTVQERECFANNLLCMCDGYC